MSDPESHDPYVDSDGGLERNSSDEDSGGERERLPHHNDRVPNLDVYAFDPTDSEGPTIRPCGGTIPRLIDPRLINRKTMFGPIVVTLEDKIYVLATKPYSGNEEDNDNQPPLFKVFDPLHQSFKKLPYPPYYDSNSSSLYGYCAWGHKLVIDTDQSDLYLFDTHKETWENWPNKKEDKWNDEVDYRNYVFDAVVDFEGFLIGVVNRELAVYQLDLNGIPKLYRDLHELQGIFCPFLLVSKCLVGKCDGGRMWLVYSGKDLMDFRYTRVAVFRVSISEDLAGNRALSAELEAAEFYAFQCSNERVSSAFSMCHHSNNRDIEEKNLCGEIIAHDHPRG
ncbi:hypothetical protein M0R45_017752 [Rubus argutus]|uniref:F-box protein n=1 Tax=Rubus argutus TaxID=59490 RepID=A0AAW1XYJ0_RUBAR